MIHEQLRRNLRFHQQVALMTERTFAEGPWFIHLGVAKHVCCFFDFNPVWELSEINATLRRGVGRVLYGHCHVTAHNIKVLGLFIHSAKRAVLLKAEL